MPITNSFVQGLIAKYMPNVGDATTSFQYLHSATNPAYNARTGEITDIPTEKPIPATLLSFSFTRNQADIREFEGESILSVDRKAIIQYIDLSPIEPRKDDILKDLTDNTEYNIIGWKLVTYDSIYLFHLRPIVEV